VTRADPRQRRLAEARLRLELRNLRADTAAKQALRTGAVLANEKLALENKKLARESGIGRRFFGRLGTIGKAVSVGVAFATAVVALFSAIHAYNQSQSENFRSLLKDLTDASPNIRLSAVARLGTYEQTETLLRIWARLLFGEPSPAERASQSIDVMAASLRAEDNINVKLAMLRLTKTLASDEQLKAHAIRVLKRLRNDFVYQLKTENAARPRPYWENLRETLFEVALGISSVSDAPPDFRCFPLKGIRVRQRVLPDRSNFDGATLALAEFWGGAMQNATFNQANLYGALIRDVDLKGTKFAGADLRGATFGPNLANIKGQEGALFRDSNWKQATSIQPRGLRRDIQRALGREKPVHADAESRDAFCTDLLSRG